MQKTTDERVSFTIRRTACASYPITTIQDATKQVYAEKVVCELAEPEKPEALAFAYHTEHIGKDIDVVLTVSGADELLVREVAQRLDEHYHGQPLYEEEVDDSCGS